ncbi:MAG: toll/interleukin-1 receptor domain-containing protein [Anaerolineae bacterium]|nr:toll/interleukin-1 receptor domain-containing protein [Anaerolineae bacterium]NUQ06852.1 toll/interleukin-1 receptor domain-containing protein [Anaerolineae bacterium]
MSHIFISYARKNTKVVSQFVESLRTQDFIVWQDISNISAGEAWRSAIYSAIDQAEIVLIFWTAAALASTVVNEEIDHALSQGKHIIPVWLEKEVVSL